MATQTLDQFILSNFPSYAWALNVPDIRNVLAAAMDPSGNPVETAGQLQSKLQATGWWQQHGDAYRNFLQLQQTDPASLATSIQAKDAEVHQLESQLGANLDPHQIDQVARNSIMFGWTQAELQEQVIGLASQAGNGASTYTPGANIGTIDNAVMALKKSASDYMIPLDDQTAFNMAREVAAGHQNAQDYTALFASQAKGRFLTLSQFIDQGITPSQVAQPLKAEAGRLLEVSPDSIDLMNDPKFSKIISYNDPGTSTPRMMTLSEEQQYVRGMDQWKNTRQAQQSVADMTEGLLQMFGKTPGGGTNAINTPSNAY